MLLKAHAFALILSFAFSVYSTTSNAQAYETLPALRETAAQPVKNFGVVDTGLYRSGQPASLDEMTALAKMGVKTIVNLQNDKTKIAREAQWAKQVGIKMISIPLSGFWAPKDRDVARIQALLNDPTKRPLLFHCAHGMERTGVEAALYRVFTMHWTPQAAYQEMKDYGFHTLVFPMKEYFEKKTKTEL